MTSERRYYDDSYTARFTGDVTARGEYAGRPAVELAVTWFYPESGGQLADRGSIGDAGVLDVQVDEDDRVWHVVDRPHAAGAAGEKTSALECTLDWSRRFDHMQQHTGQHVLSAAFERLFHVRTVSFHLGAAVSTIDLAREVPPADIAAAENEANRIVWEDRPVSIRFADSEEAARM